MSYDDEEFNKIFTKGKFLKNIIFNLFKPHKNPEFLGETKSPELEECICCGLCVDVCPTNAISVFKFRDTICEHCGACLNACPVEAIEKNRFSVDPEKCIKCGYCSIVCTIPILKNEMPVSKVPEVTKECNNCKLCIQKCPKKAISFENGKILINPEKCNLCLKCVEFCPLNALLSPEDALKSKIIKVDLNSCIFCKDCEEVCPVRK
ncbi:4Fe-4S binding protein [Methanococcus maripaludis]|uniref:Ferredoxin n=2 Tax=Methanococcus maripaludis TaxID=39152 RepID=A0A7J9PH70_METMI|nr:4Fe-4S binding protein [Methanococcus maripaludis]MBA2862563.1 ferredoxin [Methanococcus maripaludis]